VHEARLAIPTLELEAIDETDPAPLPPPPARRRRVRTAVLLVALVLLALPGESFATAMLAPGNVSPSEKAFEWLREHGLSREVNALEGWWYTHHPPRAGGVPKHHIGQIVSPGSTEPSARVARVPVHLARPTDVQSPAGRPVRNEGRWLAVGPKVDGVPLMYETQVRPDGVHTSILDGLVWMDPNLVRFQLHPGLQDPDDSIPVPSEVPMSARLALVGAFNSGMRMSDAQGGFYLDGHTAEPLRDGAASMVITRDGRMTVGQWDRDVHMGPNVVAVRQNLQLIVDGGQVVEALATHPDREWGQTVSATALLWRSGVCVDAHGAVIFGYGNGLSVFTLAELLQRAGCQRAMELDVGPAWTTYNFYGPVEAGNPASVLGVKMLADQSQPADRYLSPDARDFVAVFERSF
jgi:hypothetical protein